jgi:hypothetical protein
MMTKEGLQIIGEEETAPPGRRWFRRRSRGK